MDAGCMGLYFCVEVLIYIMFCSAAAIPLLVSFSKAEMM